MWYLYTWTGDWTHTPWLARWSLKRWTARKFLGCVFLTLFPLRIHWWNILLILDIWKDFEVRFQYVNMSQPEGLNPMIICTEIEEKLGRSLAYYFSSKTVWHFLFTGVMEKCHWASISFVSNSCWLVNSFIIHGNTIHLRGFCRDMAMQTDSNILTKRKDSFICACCNQNVLLSLSFHSQQTGGEHEEGESEQHVRVPPSGAPPPARASGRVLRPVPGHVLTTVLGNLLILLLIRLDPCLHTPMYFFLSHLALTDISFSSVTLRCSWTCRLRINPSPMLDV